MNYYRNPLLKDNKDKENSDFRNGNNGKYLKYLPGKLDFQHNDYDTWHFDGNENTNNHYNYSYNDQTILNEPDLPQPNQFTQSATSTDPRKRSVKHLPRSKQFHPDKNFNLHISSTSYNLMNSSNIPNRSVNNYSKISNCTNRSSLFY